MDSKCIKMNGWLVARESLGNRLVKIAWMFSSRGSSRGFTLSRNRNVSSPVGVEPGEDSVGVLVRGVLVLGLQPGQAMAGSPRDGCLTRKEAMARQGEELDAQR